MSAFRKKTALVAVLAVSALVFASIGAASAQQSDEASRIYQLAEKQYQEQQRRAEELQQALAQEMEMRVRPAIRMGNFFSSRSGGMAGRALAAVDELELTETQEKTIRDTQRSHRRDGIRRDADIEIAELELEEMMEADSLDLDVIESHMRQIANLQVDERMANLRLDRAVRDVLTVEQVDELEEMSPERAIYRTLQRQRRNQ